MVESDFKDLETKYFLITKRNFWYFLGGSIAFMITAFTLSYKTIIDTINKKTGEEAIKHIRDNAKESDELTSKYQSKLLMLDSFPVPVGTILAYAGKIVPNGWFRCDGHAVDSSKYPALYRVISTYWGKGSGAQGSFSVPDLRGRFLRGVFTDKNKPYHVGEFQDWSTAMPKVKFRINNSGKHNHTIGSLSQSQIYVGPDGERRLDIGSHPNSFLDIRFLGLDGRSILESQTNVKREFPNALIWSGEHSHNIEGGDEETRPMNAAVNYIIKY